MTSLKFPPISAISYSSTRSKDWDDILTAHSDETFARTWSMLKKRLGKHTFGFVDDIKGKGKERVPLGSVKVGQTSDFSVNSEKLFFIVGLCHSVR